MSLSQEPVTRPSGTSAMAPDPAKADSLDDLVEQLRRLKVWAGDPSYETIKDRINAAGSAAGRSANMVTSRSTVADCFQPGRRRVNTELVLAIVEALHSDLGYVERWRQALRVVSGQIDAATQVRVQDTLPPDLAGFAGRTGELDRLRLAAQADDAVAISAIEGMAGVGHRLSTASLGACPAGRRPGGAIAHSDQSGVHHGAVTSIPRGGRRLLSAGLDYCPAGRRSDDHGLRLERPRGDRDPVGRV